MEPLDPIRDQVERIERELAVAKRRGDPEALSQAQKALEALDQDNAYVLAFQGDLLSERGHHEKARQVYAKAHELVPNDVDIDRKLAQAIFLTMPTAGLMPSSEFESVATAKTALILSLMVPGLGQLVRGKVALGLGLLIGWLLCWLWGVSVPNGFPGLFHLFGIGQVSAPFNGVILLPIFGMAMAFAVSWGEAASALKSVEPKKKIEHPVPPVDKEFEI